MHQEAVRALRAAFENMRVCPAEVQTDSWVQISGSFLKLVVPGARMTREVASVQSETIRL